MSKRVMGFIVIVFAVALGVFIGRFWVASKQTTMKPGTMATKKPLYWIDPMEPMIRYSKPGKSRMGMDGASLSRK